MRRLLALLAGLLLALPVVAQDHVVYHINDAAEQALRGLRNIHNQLELAPDTQVIVVAHADGVDFLLEGARDPRTSQEYGPLISELKAAGVRFEVCEFTMRKRHLSRDRFVLEADTTPSGVVRLTRLQTVDHYAYIRP